jgi:hypothetical protein
MLSKSIEADSPGLRRISVQTRSKEVQAGDSSSNATLLYGTRLGIENSSLASADHVAWYPWRLCCSWPGEVCDMRGIDNAISASLTLASSRPVNTCTRTPFRNACLRLLIAIKSKALIHDPVGVSSGKIGSCGACRYRHDLGTIRDQSVGSRTC